MKPFTEESPTYHAAVEKNYRHNFIIGVLDGTFFWLGTSFIAAGVILPLFVSRLTDNPLLIGLVAVINSAGFLLPQLFTANWVQHLPIKKVLPVKLGFFSERVPIFLLPIAMAVLVPRAPKAALTVFLLLYAWHSLGAGLIAVAWQDMIAKVIPQRRRGFYMGLTNFGGTATGVIGAAFAAWLLGRYGFPTGYVYSFALAGIFIFISWLFIAQTREVPLIHNEEPVPYRKFWSSLPALLRSDSNFRIFLLTQVVMGVAAMGWGYQAVFAAQRWNLPDSQTGAMTSAILIGQSLANLAFGPLADRKGYKIVLEIGALALAASFFITLVAPGSGWLWLAFGLRGVNQAVVLLIMMFVLEFSTAGVRPTYIGLSNTLSGIASAVAPLIGGWLALSFGYLPVFWISILAGLVGWFLLRFWVIEPRRQNAAAPAAAPQPSHQPPQ